MNFGQNKYELKQHGEFIYDRDDRPFEYVGLVDGKHYMLFSNKKSGFVSLVELNQNFVPTNRSKVVLSKSDGEFEVYVFGKMMNDQLKIITKTLNTLDRTQRFYIKSVDLKSFKVSKPAEIGSSFYKLITTQDMQGYLVTDIFDDNNQLSLNFTERVSSKEAKFNAVLLNEELEPLETKSIDIPQWFIQIYENHLDFYNPKRYNNTVYSISSGKSNKEDVYKFYVNKNLDTTYLELPTDFEENYFGGGDWWVEDDKIKLFGIIKSGHTVKSRTMNGFFSGEIDLLDSSKSNITTQFLTSEFLNQYYKSYGLSSSKLKAAMKYNGVSMTEDGFKGAYEMKDGGFLIEVERFFNNDLLFAKFSSNGAFEWMKYLKHPSIKYKGKAFEFGFSVHDNVIIQLNEDMLLLRNGHIEEFSNLEKFKDPKTFSSNYSINLFEIEPNGTIKKSILLDFKNQERYVIQPLYQFIIDQSTALIYSINENEDQKFRFMTLTSSSSER